MDRARFEQALARRADRRRFLLGASAGFAPLSLPGRPTRADAYQAYYEHMPLQPSSMPMGPDMQLYRRLTYGDLSESTVLDTRQYRADQPCGDGVNRRCPAALDPTTTRLGPEQEQWLLEGLGAPTARWNVLAQQVMMAQLEQAPVPSKSFGTTSRRRPSAANISAPRSPPAAWTPRSSSRTSCLTTRTSNFSTPITAATSPSS